MLVVAHLEPHTALAEHVTVISGEHDDRVIAEPRLIECRHQFRDLGIDVAHRTVVGTSRRTHHVVADVEVTSAVGVSESMTVRVVRNASEWRDW